MGDSLTLRGARKRRDIVEVAVAHHKALPRKEG